MISHDVYLVGSVPMADAEQVFETVSAAFGSELKRIPDGETGDRADWITWLKPVFSENARASNFRTRSFACTDCAFQSAVTRSSRPGYSARMWHRQSATTPISPGILRDVQAAQGCRARLHAGRKFQIDLCPAHSVIWLYPGRRAARADRPDLQRGAQT